jgi:hypothetical protein
MQTLARNGLRRGKTCWHFTKIGNLDAMGMWHASLPLPFWHKQPNSPLYRRGWQMAGLRRGRHVRQVIKRARQWRDLRRARAIAARRGQGPIALFLRAGINLLIRSRRRGRRALHFQEKQEAEAAQREEAVLEARTRMYQRTEDRPYYPVDRVTFWTDPDLDLSLGPRQIAPP